MPGPVRRYQISPPKPKAIVSPSTYLMVIMLLDINKSIAVVVTNHNYQQYLPDALSSIKGQILKPDEVIVVDDKSDQDCKQVVKDYGYKYLQTNFGDPIKAREAGFNKTTSELVCFLDADDKLHTSYLASAIIELHKSGADIAFSDIQHFGDDNKLTVFRSDIPSKRLWQVNFLHVGCVVSRLAINMSDAFHGYPNKTDYHEDWMFWRKIVGYGFEYVKHDVPYEARIHDTNRSAKIQQNGYAAERCIDRVSERTHYHSDKSIRFLKFINSLRSTTDDYIGLRFSSVMTMVEGYDWGRLVGHLDHNIAAVHDKNFDLFDRTLFVGPVLRSYLYRSVALPFDPKTEKIIYV